MLDGSSPVLGRGLHYISYVGQGLSIIICPDNLAITQIEKTYSELSATGFSVDPRYGCKYSDCNPASRSNLRS